ncbi:MOSC domain-containing protein [Bradyrhizobium sp. JYMT SZCCT0428]|uniref:MOSC domain-containing protein n=1 Tax=Bradyrhizobium sp. JYMT SZCCT0428 TaxID=2807673 RepID=UPI001BA62A3B|nr:MOSC domain-containing protein [Bradyrhizobium sp. JYMT SZCCT0428]MBR1149646.1 MOSC domain-containing protein [Bradyrhizobium sp. JYMT SZCCT0428]
MKGEVAELWRYPVSSMAGEQLAVARIEAAGIAGDRIWGVLDEATGRIASPGREKHFIGVPRAHAKIADGGVAVSVDGKSWAGPEDASMREALSRTFGFKPMLKPFDPIGSGGFRPRYEHAPIHLLTTAALRSLSRELPDSVIDTRRFRPNILVDWPDEDEAMPEKGWIGREIRIGEVVLRGKKPCGRCGFITIEQDRLPLDVEILRRVVKRHGRDFGIYCDVVSPGHVTAGAVVAVA